MRLASRRHVVTLLHLLRREAEQQRFMHGPGIERPGGFMLTPREMDAWADAIDAANPHEPTDEELLA